MESDISVYFSWACISAAAIPKSLKHSYLTMCARPALHVCVWCVLPPICGLELVNQPVVFQWRTWTQSLTCPQRRLSLSLLPLILVLIKSAKWQSRSYKGKREEKLNRLQRSWREMEEWRTLLSRVNFDTRIKWTLYYFLIHMNSLGMKDGCRFCLL